MRVRSGPSPPLVYKVHLGRLGTRVLLRITEYANGIDASDERQSTLNAIEDVSAIAPRLAESLRSKRSLESLATTANVLPEESRARRCAHVLHARKAWVV